MRLNRKGQHYVIIRYQLTVINHFWSQSLFVLMLTKYFFVISQNESFTYSSQSNYRISLVEDLLFTVLNISWPGTGKKEKIMGEKISFILCPSCRFCNWGFQIYNYIIIIRIIIIFLYYILFIIITNKQCNLTELGKHVLQIMEVFNASKNIYFYVKFYLGFCC